MSKETLLLMAKIHEMKFRHRGKVYPPHPVDVEKAAEFRRLASELD